jgi:hypothetical protein
MSDEPTISVPVKYLWPISKAVGLILLSVAGSKTLIEPDVATVETKVVNRTDQNAYEIETLRHRLDRIEAKLNP